MDDNGSQVKHGKPAAGLFGRIEGTLRESHRKNPNDEFLSQLFRPNVTVLPAASAASALSAVPSRSVLVPANSRYNAPSYASKDKQIMWEFLKQHPTPADSDAAGIDALIAFAKGRRVPSDYRNGRRGRLTWEGVFAVGTTDRRKLGKRLSAVRKEFLKRN